MKSGILGKNQLKRRLMGLILIGLSVTLTFSLAFGGDGAFSKISRIANGVPSQPGAWPWMVALTDASGSQFCGGSLIRSTWVLTAAHCVVSKGVTSTPDSIKVVIGRTDLTTSGGQVINVAQVIPHPAYNGSTTDNDVALLQLASAANAGTAPIIGQSFGNSLLPDGTLMTVMGWGLTPAGSSSNVLLQVSLPTVAQQTCQSYYTTFDATLTITNNMFCAGYPDASADSCPGDSGGPIVFQGGPGYVQAGIVSWGPGSQCGIYKYGVYTMLSNYANWILNQTCTTEDLPKATVLKVGVTGQTVNLSWNAVAGATAYRVYYAPYPQQQPIQYADVASQTALSVPNLPHGSAYYVAIQAYKETCYSDFSNIANFTIN